MKSEVFPGLVLSESNQPRASFPNLFEVERQHLTLASNHTAKKPVLDGEQIGAAT